MSENNKRQYITYEHHPETLKINLGLSSYIFQKIEAKECSADVLVLYLFYYHHAKKQEVRFKKSDIKGAYITNNFVMKGLRWSALRMGNAKKFLLKLGLIHQKIDRDEKNKIKGWYIHVYIEPRLPKSHSHAIPSAWVEPVPGFEETSTKRLKDNRNTKRLKDNRNTGNFGVNKNISTKKLKTNFLHLFPKAIRKDKAFKKAWLEWESYHRINKKFPLTEIRVKKQKKLFRDASIEEWIAAIDKSINGGWGGLFLSDKKSIKEKKSIKDDDVDDSNIVYKNGDPEHDAKADRHNRPWAYDRNGRNIENGQTSSRNAE